jgi:hypothetical protein
MAKAALLIRIYGSIENARAAYAIDALRQEMRRAEQKTRKGHTPPTRPTVSASQPSLRGEE